MLVQDNIDLACSAIEKAAQDRAVQELEESLVTSYDARRAWLNVSNHPSAGILALMLREYQQRPGQPFWDPSIQKSDILTAMPDPLRIWGKMSITPRQALIYEEFGRSPFSLPTIYSG